MKSIFLILAALTFSSAALAGTYLTKKEQLAIVERLAKETRRASYVAGHSDVGTSDPKPVSVDQLNKHYDSRQTHVDELDTKSYNALFRCLNSEICALWSFTSWASAMSGSAEEMHFVMINVSTGQDKKINHTLYEE